MGKPTLEENTKNMERCPRFEECSIPHCPLDYFMNDRVEMPEDEKCIVISPKTKRVIGRVRGNLKRIIGRYVWTHNRNLNIPLPPCVFGIGERNDTNRANLTLVE